MDTMKHQDLTGLHQLQSFKGKPIINVTNGEQMGVVDDILIQPESLSLAAIIISKGNLLRQDLYAVPTRDIKVWGKDAVLVSGFDMLRKKGEYPELDTSLSASEAVRGREIISLDGERNGELKDFLVDQDGRLEGIEVGRVGDGLAKQLGEKNRSAPARLPVSTIHSLGKDVIIIDLNKVERVYEEPVMEYPVEETTPVEEQTEDDVLEKTD